MLFDLDVLTQVMAFTVFAFIGVEAATIPAGDVHEPDKTIPRATLIGTSAAALVYLLSTTAVFGAVPNEELQSNDAAFSVAAENMFGSWAGTAVAVVACISCLGAMNGLILLSGQIPMAAEFDGLAPRVFGKLNINHAPGSGLWISGALASLVLWLQNSSGNLGDAVATLVLVSAVATMVSYAFSAAAQIKWLVLDHGKVADQAHRAQDDRGRAGPALLHPGLPRRWYRGDLLAVDAHRDRRAPLHLHPLEPSGEDRWLRRFAGRTSGGG